MAKRGVVVGCGGMGKGWMKALQANPDAELVGVVDIRIEAARAAAAEHHLPPERAFTDLAQAVAATRPDFICDITVPEAHCPTTTAAHALGLPVIGEKPLADSMEAARRMCAAAEKSGKLSMISQSRRYDTNHLSLARALQDGAIGKITTINCDFYIGAHFGGFRDEMASPLILDMAIHHFDLCRLFARADAHHVYCHEFNPAGSWYRGDVAASAIFELDQGIVFTYRGSWCAEGCHTSWNGNWRVIGTEGTLLLEQDHFPHGQRLKPGGKAGFTRELEAVVVPRVEPGGDGINGSLKEFLACLDSGATPQCEVHDNLRSLAMVFAAMASARAKARVAVER